MLRRPSVGVRCRPSVHHFQRSSSPKPPGQSKPNFMWSLHGSGERKFVRGIWVTWPRWLPPPYMVKTLQKSSSSEPKGQWPWALVWPIKVCSNDDLGLTLTYFMARSNLVPFAFIWENLLESHLMEETYSKWPEWHEVYVYLKFWPQGFVCPCPGAIYMYKKHEKSCIKSDFNDIFFETCNKWAKWQGFPVDIGFCPQRIVCPCPGAIYMWKNIKKCI